MSVDEFPCLTGLGLYARNIPGDGNCLFSALSDQVYGNITHSADIRASTIQHVRNNKDYYVQFIDVVPGGGTRQQPKRKASSAYASSARARAAPTAEEIDRAFDNRVRNMSKNGTYGDHLEIAAFASRFNLDVYIYQAESSYVVSPNGALGQTSMSRPAVHIAYHASYLHYSSVRNRNGPHVGLPEVQRPPETVPNRATEAAASSASVPPWMVKTVVASCPYLIDEAGATRALLLNHNSIVDAVSYLVDQDSSNGTPDMNSIQSSSIERELGSDEEGRDGPQKRQDRRLSRARKERQQNSLREKLAGLDATSLDSLLRFKDSPTRVMGGEDWDTASSPPALEDGSTTPESSYSPSSEESMVKPGPTIKLKLNVAPSSRQSSLPATVTKLVLKHKSPPKRLSARDAKPLKKQAQKQARKERAKQQAMPQEQAPSAGNDMPSSQTSFGSQPAVTSGFRTMHI